MSRPGFVEGVLLALIFAVAAAAAAFVLPAALQGAAVARLLAAALAAAYVAYLLVRSGARTGRVAVPLAWLVVTVAGWSSASVAGFVLLQAGTLWLVRSVYLHGHVLSALADLALTAFALAAAAWAYASGSTMLAVWTFFLLQACFVWIPGAPARIDPDADESTFDDALDRAEAALARLGASHR